MTQTVTKFPIFLRVAGEGEEDSPALMHVIPRSPRPQARKLQQGASIVIHSEFGRYTLNLDPPAVAYLRAELARNAPSVQAVPPDIQVR